MKKKACAQVGILDLGVDLPSDTSEQDLLALITRLNHDPNVHGILVQLPLPPHLDEKVGRYSIKIKMFLSHLEIYECPSSCS